MNCKNKRKERKSEVQVRSEGGVSLRPLQAGWQGLLPLSSRPQALPGCSRKKESKSEGRKEGRREGQCEGEVSQTETTLNYSLGQYQPSLLISNQLEGAHRRPNHVDGLHGLFLYVGGLL